jgi:RHS repeat-associated protein
MVRAGRGRRAAPPEEKHRDVARIWPSETDIADVEYLLADQLGSVRVITDAVGAVVGSASFGVFGAAEAASGVASAFGFTGAWTDDETGLVYLRARDYDPATGQFLQVDPAVDDTRQPYAYAYNNPLLWTDPTGLDVWGDIGEGLLGFGAGLLDGLTGGASSAILGQIIPSYDCFTQSNPYFQAGSVVGQVLDTVMTVLAIASGVGALGVLAVQGIKAIVKLGIKAAIKKAAGAIKANVRNAIQSAKSVVTQGARNTSTPHVPTVAFSRTKAPNIAANFDNAVANGAPTRLTRVDKATRNQNRRDALRRQPRPPAGQSLDEYPFASSAEGGSGSVVRAVPEGEQDYQGGVLSRFYQNHGVNPGDVFNVVFEP